MKISVLMLLLLACSKLFAQELNDSLVFRLDFQKHFQNDTVTLLLEDRIVFQNYVVTTVRNLGYAGPTVSIYFNTPYLYVIKVRSYAQKTSNKKIAPKIWALHKLTKTHTTDMEIIVNGQRFHKTLIAGEMQNIGISRNLADAYRQITSLTYKIYEGSIPSYR